MSDEETLQRRIRDLRRKAKTAKEEGRAFRYLERAADDIEDQLEARHARGAAHPRPYHKGRT